MGIFEWNDRFLTGEPIVDSEHKELVRIINWVAHLHSRPDQAGETAAVLGSRAQIATQHAGLSALAAQHGSPGRYRPEMDRASPSILEHHDGSRHSAEL